MGDESVDPPAIGEEPSPIAAFPLPRRSMIVLACLTATVAGALLYDVLPPIIRDLADHFGGGLHGQFIAQLAGSLPLFGVMLGGLIVGRLVESFGMRPTLLGAMLLFGVAGSAGVMIDGSVPFLASRLLMGLGAGVMMTACNALVTIYFRGSVRARMNGLIVGVGAIGGVLFVLVAGWTAAWFWRAPFLLHGAVVLVFLLPVLLTGPIPMAATVHLSWLGGIQRLRPMLPVCAAGFCWFVVMLMNGVQAPFLMVEAGIRDHGTIAVLYALNAGAVSLSSLVLSRWTARFEPVTVLRAAFLMLAAGQIGIATVSTVAGFAATLAWNGTTIGIGLPALWTWAMRRAPHDLVARSLGAMTTCLYLGGAAMPLLTAPYRLSLGLRGQFPAMAATIAVTVVALWIAGRLHRPSA